MSESTLKVDLLVVKQEGQVQVGKPAPYVAFLSLLPPNNTRSDTFDGLGSRRCRCGEIEK